MRLIFAAALCCGLAAPAVSDAQSFRAACNVRSLCPNVEPGGGRLVACLRAHKHKLSVPCKLAIADFFLNKQGRGAADGGPRNGPDDGPARGQNPDDGPPPNEPRGAGPDARPGPYDQGSYDQRPYDQGPDDIDPNGPDAGPPPSR